MFFPSWQEGWDFYGKPRKQRGGLVSSIVKLLAITKQTQNFNIAYRRSALLAGERRSGWPRFAISGAFASYGFLTKASGLSDPRFPTMQTGS
jgi:hypothetical protein